MSDNGCHTTTDCLSSSFCIVGLRIVMYTTIIDSRYIKLSKYNKMSFHTFTISYLNMALKINIKDQNYELKALKLYFFIYRYFVI